MSVDGGSRSILETSRNIRLKVLDWMTLSRTSSIKSFQRIVDSPRWSRPPRGCKTISLTQLLALALLKEIIKECA